jgi:hypothetical protein
MSANRSPLALSGKSGRWHQQAAPPRRHGGHCRSCSARAPDPSTDVAELNAAPDSSSSICAGRSCVQPSGSLGAGLALGAAGALPFSQRGHRDADQHKTHPRQRFGVIGPRAEAPPAQPLTHAPQRGHHGSVIG